MKDIRSFIPEITPMIFKDDVNLLYVKDDEYIAYSMIGWSTRHKSINSDSNEEFYKIVSDIIPATAITIDAVGTHGKTTDYLIAWFDNARDNGFSYAGYTEGYIGIANKEINEADIEFLEKYHDVDSYSYLKSINPLENSRIKQIIEKKVIVLDKVPLENITDVDSKYYRRRYPNGVLDIQHEKANQHKISIPHKIQPLSQNNWSNIRIAKIDLSKFGGNTVYPFAWLQKTTIIKKEN